MRRRSARAVPHGQCFRGPLAARLRRVWPMPDQPACIGGGGAPAGCTLVVLGALSCQFDSHSSGAPWTRPGRARPFPRAPVTRACAAAGLWRGVLWQLASRAAAPPRPRPPVTGHVPPARGCLVEPAFPSRHHPAPVVAEALVLVTRFGMRIRIVETLLFVIVFVQPACADVAQEPVETREASRVCMQQQRQVGRCVHGDATPAQARHAPY